MAAPQSPMALNNCRCAIISAYRRIGDVKCVYKSTAKPKCDEDVAPSHTQYSASCIFCAALPRKKASAEARESEDKRIAFESDSFNETPLELSNELKFKNSRQYFLMSSKASAAGILCRRTKDASRNFV